MISPFTIVSTSLPVSTSFSEIIKSSRTAVGLVDATVAVLG